jgi:hypothetical protein
MIDFLSPTFTLFGGLSVPWLLVGGLAALVPVLIHLSRSKRMKKMRFSTTRFFTDQFLRSYRMSRLKELLLLACRMALCALLAMAFAQPLFMPKGQPLLAGKARSVVLVLDNSASMGLHEGENGPTPLDRARDAARDLIGGLHEGDVVSIILAGRQAEGPAVLCELKPHAEIGDVVQEVNTVAAATVSADLSAAVARAEQIAAGSPQPSKEVYVFSDLQESGWDTDGAQLSTPPDPDVLFFFVRLRPRKVANVAVTAVQYDAARPMVGVPFAIRPLFVSQGETAPQSTVSLYLYDKDGKAEKVGERSVDRLQGGRWAAPRFYHTFQTGGWHAGYVEVEDHNLPQDNRRYFALHVLDSVAVLAINGAPSEVPRLDELFFFRAALSASQAEHSPVHVRVASPAVLADENLAKYPLVVLANVARLSAPAVEKLEAYVDGGGSLLVFLGDKVEPAFYNQNLTGAGRPHGGLLPARLEAKKGKPGVAGEAEESYATFASLAYGHPALAGFQDGKLGNLAGVTFQALWEVTPDPEQAVVLAWAKERAKEGQQAGAKRLPLLCEKEFGKGRVLLFTSTCNRAWTNFPVRPAFLPWVHRLVGYLAQRPLEQQGFFTTGDAVPVPVAVAEGMPPALVKKPDGTTGYATMSSDPERPLVFTDTSQAGVYTLYPDQKERAQPFAVNLDRFESDLSYLFDDVLGDPEERAPSKEQIDTAQAEMKKLLPGRPLVYLVADPGQIGEVSLTARHSSKLWMYVLAVVLILALLEPWLANRISLRHYARPDRLPETAPPRVGRWGRIPTSEAAPPAEEVSAS